MGAVTVTDPLARIKSNLAALPEFPTTTQAIHAWTEIRHALPALIAEVEMLRADAKRFWGRVV